MSAFLSNLHLPSAEIACDFNMDCISYHLISLWSSCQKDEK